MLLTTEWVEMLLTTEEVEMLPTTEQVDYVYDRKSDFISCRPGNQPGPQYGPTTSINTTHNKN